MQGGVALSSVSLVALVLISCCKGCLLYASNACGISGYTREKFSRGMTLGRLQGVVTPIGTILTAVTGWDHSL